LQIKRVYKICDNDLAPKKGDADYDPGYTDCDPVYKYDNIYKCLVHSIDKFTQLGDLDLCGDKTTCGHGGFREAGSGLLARQLNKPGINTLITKNFQIAHIQATFRPACKKKTSDNTSKNIIPGCIPGDILLPKSSVLANIRAATRIFLPTIWV
jgi:hypothetical protein